MLGLETACLLEAGGSDPQAACTFRILEKLVLLRTKNGKESLLFWKDGKLLVCRSEVWCHLMSGQLRQRVGGTG